MSAIELPAYNASTSCEIPAGVAGTVLVPPSAVRDSASIAAPPLPGVLVEPAESVGALPT